MAVDRDLEYRDEYEYAPARTSERGLFMQRTYAHLAGAILAFIGLEALLLKVVPAETIMSLWGGGRMGFLVVLLLFMGVSWLAQVWARSDTSRGLQYAGLGLYVAAEAIIMLPLLWIATYLIKDQSLIPTAGILTLGVFGGLTWPPLPAARTSPSLGRSFRSAS